MLGDTETKQTVEKALGIEAGKDYLKRTLARIGEQLEENTLQPGILSHALVEETGYNDNTAEGIAEELIFFLVHVDSPLRKQQTEASIQALPYGSEVIQAFLTTDSNGNTMLLQVDKTPAAEGYVRLNIRMKPYADESTPR